MPDEKQEAALAPVTEQPSSGPGKLVLILVGVNLLITLGLIGVLFISFQKESGEPTVHDIAADEPAHGEEAAEGEGGGGGGHGEAAKAGGHGGAGGETKAAKGHAIEFGRMVTLEQFTINLSTPGSVSPKFVRVNISVEVPNTDAEAEVNQKMPQVRNVIIDLFNSKRPADLATAEGRDYIKEEIRNALNGFLVTGKVKGVYFTNFAVSS